MTHSDDATASELWNQWQKLCAEKHSWSVFQLNRIKRANEIGKHDYAALAEIDRARHVLDGLASLTMAKYELARAGVDASTISPPRL
ncbi:hypothetical protein DFQ14_104271 [Halopolyspora algeriensis]|uniref:Uncharacterized protein n=1 Tax=Halopolyspora algeriensis TaxID=1500506 RepID=A0A368VSG1_9ACTN|nr:hypothetical protein [Halopolyspora algeriensis]RCW44681.1 hypothetical protein DFQ14_104271 [Halopolyspora algeriensis]TQM56039.1 hypothetical protein FHU43_0821 [Halopolyspora algeriensis]